MNWIECCPRPALLTDDAAYVRRNFNGLSPWRALEIGIRLFSTWMVSYQRLIMCPLMTAEVHEKFVISLYEQAEVLAEASPILWPRADHNHYIHEVLGLLVVACNFPEWKKSAEWRGQAIREMVRCAQAQITPEGGQIEGCPGYHDISVGMLISTAEIMQENGIDIPAELAQCIDSAANYSAWTLKPTGLIASVGDSAINCAAIAPHARQYKKIFGSYGAYGKCLPLIPGCEAAPISDEPAGVYHFRTLGQITARTGWSKTDSFFMLICHTPVNNGHSHQDPMNFLLTLQGEDIITDPSFYTYTNGEGRKRFKSPEYHSCLTFGGRPPFEYLNTWSFGPQKPGATAVVYESHGAHSLLAGDASHENYAPAEHRRLCALIDDDLFIVADDVKNPAQEAVRLYFHMDARVWEKTAEGAASPRIRAILPEDTAWELADSEKSPRVDRLEPSQRIIVTDGKPAAERIYLTVFSADPTVRDAAAVRTERGVEISLKKTGEAIRLLWKFGESCVME